MSSAWSIPGRCSGKLGSSQNEQVLTCYTAAKRGWIQPYGAPIRIFHDAVSAFKGTVWGELWGRHGTFVSCSAAEAPWQHGSIEVFWRVLRRALRLTWMSFADNPQATPEDALVHTINARNDIGRLVIGVSPSQLVLNRQPRRQQGYDLGEDIDARLASDPTFC